MGETSGSRRGSRRELSREEVDAVLETVGVGTLGLAADGQAYTIPVSFGYDGHALYFQLAIGENCKKVEYIEQTDRASFSVTRFEGADRWDSVSVVGELEQVPGCDLDLAIASMTENAVLAEFAAFDGMTDLSFCIVRLVPDEITSRTAHTA
ncbi:pyridoxamine 5'-phosphate oxidase family protein [Halobacteriaceae archaeon GCM10025711]